MRFAAHRSVLVEQSPYFRSMLEGTFAEQNSREVELKEFVEPALMGQVLHFLYFKSGERKMSATTMVSKVCREISFRFLSYLFGDSNGH